MSTDAERKEREIWNAQFERVFQAAHRLTKERGKCQRIHGHNFHVEVDVWTDALTPEGFVVNFYHVKEFIDSFDHRLILEDGDPLIAVLDQEFPEDWVVTTPVSPSTENFAKIIAEGLLRTVFEHNKEAEYVGIYVKLRETDSISSGSEVGCSRGELETVLSN